MVRPQISNLMIGVRFSSPAPAIKYLEINIVTMFNAVKEIIWHLTCAQCKGWFTFATMEEKYCIERTTFYCPHCGHKGRTEINSLIQK